VLNPSTSLLRKTGKHFAVLLPESLDRFAAESSANALAIFQNFT
jgi:hypothetical protein